MVVSRSPRGVAPDGDWLHRSLLVRVAGRRARRPWRAGALLSALLLACGSEEASNPDEGGLGGGRAGTSTGGTAGVGGARGGGAGTGFPSGGTSGASGAKGGASGAPSGGQAGQAGAGGASGVAGQGGSVAAGQGGAGASPSGGQAGQGEQAGSAGTAGTQSGQGGAGAPPGPPPTIEDFWERRAYFELDTRVLAPSPPPSQSNVHYNADNDVEVHEGVMYWFTRAFKDPKKAECPTDHAQTLVRTSIDNGASWSAPVVVLDNEPVSAADGCSANDGDAFYDAETGLWHFLYQCLADPKLDPGWHLCHATRPGKPDGPFDKDPQNPVARGGDIWNLINPAAKFFDEGTPEIVEKRDGYFYLTFHGVEPTSPIKIVRGVARTKDFHAFEAINGKDIFSWPNANSWDIQWKGGSSFGGGQATVLRQGDFYYEIIEAADTNGGCQNGQGWAIGLMRAPSLGADWSPAPQAVLMRESHEPLSNGLSGPCHVGYVKLFHGASGELRLAHWRGANDRFPMESDPAAGHFFLTLRRGAPAARFRFAEGPGHTFALADVISRGDLQLALQGPGWVPGADGTFALRFDGSPARAVAQASPVFDRAGDFRLRIDATFTALPPGKSGFIAGNPGHYWLELYQDGNLCVWVAGPGGNSNACQNIAADVGKIHTYEGELAGDKLRLYRDDVLVAEGSSGPPAGGGGFEVGSATPVGDVLGPIVMDLDAVSFWDRSR